MTHYPDTDIIRESFSSSEFSLKESKNNRKEEQIQNREKVFDKDQFQQMAREQHNSRKEEMYRRNRKDRNAPQKLKNELQRSEHTKGDKDIQSK